MLKAALKHPVPWCLQVAVVASWFCSALCVALICISYATLHNARWRVELQLFLFAHMASHTSCHQLNDPPFSCTSLALAEGWVGPVGICEHSVNISGW